MTRRLLVNQGIGETRLALVADGRLTHYDFERDFHDGPRRGDIVLGRVEKIAPALEAAFVDIGAGRAGFLSHADAQNPVREGDGLLVEITREPVGEKGARLSAAPSLAGHMLVASLGRPGVAVSRRIAEPARSRVAAEGAALQARLGNEYGLLIRTAAADASAEALAREADALAALWADLRARAKLARPPSTLYRAPGLLIRALRDGLGEGAEVLIDDARAGEEARAWCRGFAPALAGQIQTVPAPLFDDALESEIAGLFEPRVALPSGGWIIIEATEGLTAIDVNSGFIPSSSREQTALATNLEAAAEIGRQLRLRAIGGLCVIDFIQLSRPDHAAKVAAALKDSLAPGKMPAEISPMSDFGIIAVARKRLGPSLMERMGRPCATCGGRGHLASIESAALDLVRRAEGEANAHPGREVLVTATPEIADWLSRHHDRLRPDLMRRGLGRVRFETGKEKCDVRPV